MICLSSVSAARTGFPRAFLEFELLGKILDAYFCFRCKDRLSKDFPGVSWV
jgi:hypothetical protein